VQDAAGDKVEATLVTLVGGIKVDAAEKNIYTNISFYTLCSKMGLPILLQVISEELRISFGKPGADDADSTLFFY
jgi:hypothetical protein